MNTCTTLIWFGLNFASIFTGPNIFNSEDLKGLKSKHVPVFDIYEGNDNAIAKMSDSISPKRTKRGFTCKYLDNFDFESMPFQKQLKLKKEMIDSTETRLNELKTKVRDVYDVMMEVLSMEDTMLDVINYNDLDLIIKKPIDSIFNDESTPKAKYLRYVIEKLSIYYSLFNYIINERVDGKLIHQNLHQLTFSINNVICNLKVLLTMDNESVEEEAIKILKMNETNDKSQKYMRNVLIIRHFKNFLQKNRIMEILA